MTNLESLRDYAMLDGERLQMLWAEIDRLRGLLRGQTFQSEPSVTQCPAQDDHSKNWHKGDDYCFRCGAKLGSNAPNRSGTHE